MNHPSHEELVDFLDGELAVSRQAEVARHVEGCGECSAIVASWRDVQIELPSWKLGERPAVPISNRRGHVRQYLRQVAAAAVLLAVGFGLARVTAPDLAQVRTDLAQQLGSELRNEFQSDLLHYAAAQSVEQQAIVQAVQDLDTRWLADFGGLRRDIETVAVRTQEEFARLSSSAP